MNKPLATIAILMLLIGTFGMAFSFSPAVGADGEYVTLTMDYYPSDMDPVPVLAPTVGEHNVTKGSEINITAPLVVNGTTLGVRYVFVNWMKTFTANGTFVGNQTEGVNSYTTPPLDDNYTYTAVYKVQYLFTVVTAFDLPYIWYGSAWHQESSHWFDQYDIAYGGVANEHVDLNFSMKAKFTEWTGDWSGKQLTKSGWNVHVQAGPINMTGPKTIIANWVIEYYLTKGAAYNPWGPTVPYALGGYYTAIENAIDRIVLLQKKSPDYGWDWVVTGATGPSGTTYKNIQSVTALGLLCAFEKTENMTYFLAAQDIADYYYSTGDPSTGAFQTAGYGFGPDYMFLAKFSEISGVSKYKDFAIDAWNYQKSGLGGPNGDRYADNNQTFLYNYFYNNWVSSHGIVIWNCVFYALGALALGDTAWAENMTAVIAANFTKITNDGCQYIGWGHALKLFQAIDPIGYTTEIASAVNSLKSSQQYSGSWPGDWVQDAAYAIMGLAAVGETAAAEKGADWLVKYQLANGGWADGSPPTEISEVISEASQALCAVAKCWYKEYRLVDLTAPSYVNVKTNKWRWRFDHWTVEKWNGTHWVDSQTFLTQSITVNMDMPTRATVYFWLQYYLTVSDSPTSLDTSLESYSGYYDYCSNVTITAPDPVPDPSDPDTTRWVFDHWWLDAVFDVYNTTVTVHIEASTTQGKTLYAIYTKEYYLEVQDNIGGLSGVATQSGWFPPTTGIPLSAPSIIPVDSDTRYVFVEWVKDPGHWTDVNCNTTININGPRNATAYYKKQYRGTWMANPVDTGIVNLNTWNGWSTIGGEGWFDENSLVWWSCKSGPAPGSPFDYVFDHWTVNGVPQTQYMNNIQINFTGPMNTIAEYVGKPAFFITPQSVVKDAPAECTTFTVNITAANLVDLYAMDFNVTWDPTLLELVDVDVEVDEIWTQYFIAKNEINNTAGYYWFVATSLDDYGFNGTHKIVALTFHIIYDPCYIAPNYYVECDIDLNINQLSNHNAQQINPWNIHGGYYRINALQPKIEMRPGLVTASQKDLIFTVEIWIVDAVKLHDWYAFIEFNTAHLDILDVEIDTTFLTGPYEFFYYHKTDNYNGTHGSIEIHVKQQQPGETLAYGEGRLAILTFKVNQTIFWTTPSNPMLHSWIAFDDVEISVKCPSYTVIPMGLLDVVNCEYKYIPIPGDVNMDGIVNVLDLQLVAADYGSTTTYDLDEDADVDLIDLVLVAINFGRDEP